MIERGMFRSRKLLDISHFCPCFLQIPGVCQSGVNPSVPCHSNLLRHGRGHAHKSHDCYAVPGCVPCHHELDHGTKLSKDEREAIFTAALERYWLHLFRYGYVSVAKHGERVDG